MTYKVELDIYNGPMDLLLYLIRREEVDITDLPIARIADQYLAYLDMLTSLDIELAGDFVVMAATLLELKSRALLPRPPEIEDDIDGQGEEDPRETLIRQLIEYRRFKEAAALLDDRGREMARRFPRQFDDALLDDLQEEVQEEAPADLLQGIEVWDLIGAFSQVIRTLGYSSPREVIYDDTPVEVVGKELLARLEQEKSVLFTQLFAGGRSLNYCITMFLALLELARQRHIGAEQAADFKDIRIFLRDPSAEEPPKAVAPKGARPSREAMKRKRPRRPSASQVARMHEMMEDLELEKTEFDEILDAIRIPDVEAFKPLYSEGELLGRKDAGAAAPPEPAAAGPDSPPEAPEAQPEAVAEEDQVDAEEEEEHRAQEEASEPPDDAAPAPEDPAGP